jgi:hypothetical protein
VDPTGHCAEGDTDCIALEESLEETYVIVIAGIWTLDEMLIVQQVLKDLEIGMGGMQFFLHAFSGVTLSRMDAFVGRAGNAADTDAETTGEIRIFGQTFYDSEDSKSDILSARAQFVILSEFGHRWDNSSDDHQYANSHRQATGGRYSPNPTPGPVSADDALLYTPGQRPGSGYFSKYSHESQYEDMAESFAAYMYTGSWAALDDQNPNIVDNRPGANSYRMVWASQAVGQYRISRQNEW